MWINPQKQAPKSQRLYLICMRDTDGNPDLYDTDIYNGGSEYNPYGWMEAAYEVVAYQEINQFRGEQ